VVIDLKDSLFLFNVPLRMKTLENTGRCDSWMLCWWAVLTVRLSIWRSASWRSASFSAQHPTTAWTGPN